MKTKQFDVIIIGGGASGLMCAIQAGIRGRKVCVVDHAESLGNKIRISGGGRCNFTNLDISSEKYLSENIHFCKSALAQFTQYNFIEMIKEHNISYHEKTLGQLFCDGSAKEVLNMLLSESKRVGVEFSLNTNITSVKKDSEFLLETSKGLFKSKSLVIATGGLSIPKIGATNFGFKIAQQFNIEVIPTTPALVPLTFSEKDKEIFNGLAGVSFQGEVTCGKTSFTENILFTHRGLSGPAILQISSFWKQGQEIKINILPEHDWQEFFKKKRKNNPKQELKTVLCEVLQKRFVNVLFNQGLLKNIVMVQVSDKYIKELVQFFTQFTIKPNGTEGYRKAEITKGGVSTKELNSKTLECKNVEGLFFVGELVDVTGWLGGYNFQWAWSSGYAAGQVV
ncbi:MAG: NAD(P)/FAD-dependent oxidoreductase [Proteobacteria bacterium]|nr:NAD(P)/FAD-dependent oxidoreductase [Pseudomonadota bacterium]